MRLVVTAILAVALVVMGGCSSRCSAVITVRSAGIPGQGGVDYILNVIRELDVSEMPKSFPRPDLYEEHVFAVSRVRGLAIAVNRNRRGKPEYNVILADPESVGAEWEYARQIYWKLVGLLNARIGEGFVSASEVDSCGRQMSLN